MNPLIYAVRMPDIQLALRRMSSNRSTLLFTNNRQNEDSAGRSRDKRMYEMDRFEMERLGKLSDSCSMKEEMDCRLDTRSTALHRNGSSCISFCARQNVEQSKSNELLTH
jgi:hypothetical protein